MTALLGSNPRRHPLRLLAIVGVLLLLVAVAIPAFAAAPVVGPGPVGADDQPAQAEKSPNPNRGPKEKKAKVPKTPISLSGTVTAATDADGRREYRMASGGKTYILDAGPTWFYGDKHPLEGSVGKRVTIAGEVAADSTEVEVGTVDGKAVREEGRPPWAGGWKVVGKTHPGWSQEKADRHAEKMTQRKAKFGDCFPPGRCKQAEPAD